MNLRDALLSHFKTQTHGMFAEKHRGTVHALHVHGRRVNPLRPEAPEVTFLGLNPQT